jgi:serine/threonine protein kinase/Tfp pilus assembly protein PilF
MTPEKYQRVKAVLSAVLDTPAEERERCISEQCSGDTGLESSVRRLLARFGSSGMLDEIPIEREELGRLMARLDEPRIPDTLLAGRFRLIRFLGAGGMGEVWEAFDEELRQAIAVKLIRGDIALDPKAVERFKREVLNARSVSHPNVCRVHDLFIHQSSDGDSPFLTMQLVPGETLAARLERGPIGKAVAQRLLQQCASALAAAHRSGMVHGDLKPGNVMLTGVEHAELMAIVMDFGLARSTSRTGARSAASLFVGGTPAYMPPEQAEGKPLTPAADVYAFGILVCEVLTGLRPAEGGLDRLAPGLRPRVGAALSPDPSARPISPAEVLQEKPVRRRFVAALVLLLIACGGLLWYPFRSKAKPKSVAVLPFTMQGAPAEDQYFNEYLSDEIIAALSRATELRVLAQNSTSQFTGPIRDVGSVARKLHAQFVVLGNLRFTGGRVEAAAELIDPETNAVVWSRTFDRDRSQMAALHIEIARGIADQLGVRKGRVLLSAFGPEPPAQDATDLYLRGRALWALRGRQNLRDALDAFEKAIQMAPDFAAAHAARAETLMIMAEASYIPSEGVLPQAKDSALQSLILDPQLPEAQAALGLVQSIGEWDFYNAAKSLERALQLNPSSAYAHQWYASVLLKTGNPGRAVQEAELAATIDPLSPAAAANVGWTKFYTREFDGALRVADQLARDFPQFPYTCLLRADSYFGKRQFANSLAALDGCSNDIRNNPMWFRSLSGAQAGLGNRAAVENALDRILAMRDRQPVADSSLAVVYTSLGRRDEAFGWLDQGIIHHDPLTALVDVTPYFDGLRSDPRYLATLQRVGIPYRK